MTSVTTFSITNDFSDGVRIPLLRYELNQILPTNENYYVPQGDRLRIRWKTPLEANEVSAVNAVVAAHDPLTSGPPEEANTIAMQTRTDHWRRKTFTRMATFVFGGTDEMGSVKDIGVLSHAENKNKYPAPGTYDIRIYDMDNHVVLAESTLSNTDDALQYITQLTLFPRGITSIEVQGRRNSAKSFYCSNISISL